MPVFTYQAISADGKTVSGTYSAELTNDVETWLAGKNLCPIEITASEDSNDAASTIYGVKELSWLDKLKGVSLDDRILFCRQVATMLGAGVAILQALKIMARQSANPILQTIIYDVADDIENGENLSDAFGKYPKEFDLLFQNIILVGEESGSLDISFDYLARVYENEKDVQEKIKAATRYPKIVIVGIMTAVVFLMAFVVPKFIDMFSKSKVELPLPTKILIGTSNLFSEHLVLLILTVSIGIFAYFKAMKSKDFVRFKDSISLKIPVLGVLSIKVFMSRFCRVFAVLSKSGIDIIKTLKLASTSLDNLVLYENVENVTRDVERGVNLYEALEKRKLFPDMVVQMVSIGEESGTLDVMMDKVADYYEVETDYTIKRLSTLIEPVLLLAMGLIVSLLALAIYMPMWNMMNVMR